MTYFFCMLIKVHIPMLAKEKCTKFGLSRCIVSIYIYIHTVSIPVVPARGGAEVALKIYIYKTFLIYRTCMRRAPARPVRACFVRSCCSVAVQERDLRVTPVQCKHFPHTSHCTLHTPHSTLHTCTSSQLISSELTYGKTWNEMRRAQMR